jgi:hypothetical protein
MHHYRWAPYIGIHASMPQDHIIASRSMYPHWDPCTCIILPTLGSMSFCIGICDNTMDDDEDATSSQRCPHHHFVHFSAYGACMSHMETYYLTHVIFLLEGALSLSHIIPCLSTCVKPLEASRRGAPHLLLVLTRVNELLHYFGG